MRIPKKRVACPWFFYLFLFLMSAPRSCILSILFVYHDVYISQSDKTPISFRWWWISPKGDTFLLYCIKIIIIYSSLMENFSLVNSHSLLGNPLILPQIQILISFWSQKAENQKFEIEEKVMSERVKMPNRHFLRSDYLHFFFYLKFLVFVSLVFQISIFQ